MRISIFTFIIFPLLVLTSCRTGNFNRQKFTNLRAIKVEKSQTQESLVSIENVENESFSKITIINKIDPAITNIEQRINIDKIELDVRNENKESTVIQKVSPPDSTEIAIEKAIRRGHVFIIQLNGTHYKLENPYYDKESQTLQGDIVFIEDYKSIDDDKIMLDIDDYQILGSNGLATHIDNIELSNDQKSTVITSSNQKNDSPRETDPADKRKGFIFLGLGASLILVGAILGMPFAFAGIIFGLIFLIISASILNKRNTKSKNNSDKTKEPKKPSNKTSITILFGLFAIFILALGIIAYFLLFLF